jgi:hypothetical protein
MLTKSRKLLLVTLCASLISFAFIKYFNFLSPNQGEAQGTDNTSAQIDPWFGQPGVTAIANMPTESLDRQKRIQIKPPQKIETVENPESSIDTNPLIDIDTLIKTINELPSGSQQRLSLEKSIIDQITQNPKIRDSLLEQYVASDSDSERELLAGLIAMGLTTDAETRLLNEISYGSSEFHDTVAGAIKFGPASSVEEQNITLSELASSSDDQVIEAKILSIYPTIGDSNAEAGILEQVVPYFDSSNSEDVKRAVVRVVSRWGDEKYAHIIERALTDESSSVRDEALLVLKSSGFRGEAIKTTLIQAVMDNSKSFEERLASMTALEQFQMTDSEYDALNENLF